jgi:hypothetical protein
VLWEHRGASDEAGVHVKCWSSHHDFMRKPQRAVGMVVVTGGPNRDADAAAA